MSAPVASRLFQQMRNPDEALTPREAELLTLLTQGLTTTDTQAAAMAYTQMQQIVYNDAPWVFGWVPNEIEVGTMRVKGWVPGPDGSTLLLHMSVQ